ncbi:MAG: hypothetical protein PHE68_04645, partial [Candidatus Peribacteraceae bacterium]|nr:hypothetical protein [Candidatus Peribacteraceae bacterium]
MTNASPEIGKVTPDSKDLFGQALASGDALAEKYAISTDKRTQEQIAQYRAIKQDLTQRFQHDPQASQQEMKNIVEELYDVLTRRTYNRKLERRNRFDTDGEHEQVQRERQKGITEEQGEKMKGEAEKTLQKLLAQRMRLSDEYRKMRKGAESEKVLEAVGQCDREIRKLTDLVEQGNAKSVEEYRSRVETFIASKDPSRQTENIRNFLDMRQSHTFIPLSKVEYVSGHRDGTYLTHSISDDYIRYGNASVLRELALKQKGGFLTETQAPALIDDTKTAVDWRMTEIDRSLRSLRNSPNNSPDVQQAENAFQEDSKVVIELAGSIDENSSPNFYDGREAADYAERLIDHMSLEEAMRYVTELNNKTTYWTSREARNAQKELFAGCRRALEKKLADYQKEAERDPAKMTYYRQCCNHLATCFRSGATIGGEETSIGRLYVGKFRTEFSENGFASRMAMRGMDYDEMVLRYAETTLHRENPLKEKIEQKKSHVMGVLDDVRRSNDPAIRQFMESEQAKQMIAVVEGQPTTPDGLVQQYGALRTLESLFDPVAHPLKQEDFEKEVKDLLLPFLDAAHEEFKTFLNRGFSGAGTPALQEATGVHLNAQQIEAYGLLASIEGHGWGSLSDDTWARIKEGTKIAINIAVGIGVMSVLGPLGVGVLASGAIGGLAGFGTAVAMEGRTYETAGEALKDAGTDMALGVATSAAGRVFTAMRYAAFARNGKPPAEIFKLALTSKGLEELAQSPIALRGLTRFAVTSTEGMANAVTGAGLDSYMRGTDFVESLKFNMIFFGMHLGGEYSRDVKGSLSRVLGGGASMPQAEMEALATLSMGITKEAISFHEKCFKAKVDPKTLLDSEQPEALVQSLPSMEKDALMNGRTELLARVEKLKAMLDVTPKAESVTSSGIKPDHPIVSFEEASKMKPEVLPKVIRDAGKQEVEFGKAGYRFTDLAADSRYKQEGGW